MAKVILHPIGTPIEEAVDERAYSQNVERMEELNGLLRRRRDEVHDGWGAEYINRVHAKGKLTSWERIEILKDAGTAVFPINTFVNYGLDFGKPPRTSPSAGVITAFVRVHGRLTVVIANDNTVASGSWWPMTPEKIERAQEAGLRLRVPVIYLVDCSGLNLPEQSRTFPGRIGAGYIFKMNSLLSASGVPQIAGVLGGHDISILSVMQKEAPAETTYVPVVIVTHPAREENLARAVAEIDTLDVVKGPSVWIRMEQ